MSETLQQTTTQAAEGVDRADVRAVNKTEHRELYKKREPIYPKLVHGRFRALKWFLLAVTLGIYYALPWLRWPRGAGVPNQAVLVDFVGRRFYFFFIELWPQEVYYITGLLILAALSLFLVTSLFGRVWCGYACPQTVWTDLYIAVERLVEGDRSARMRLAKSKWSAEKVTKKAVKHGLWLIIAMLTGGAWVFYFHDAPTLFHQIVTGTAPVTTYVFVGILTFTTYTLAGTMREQVCTYMCPWPRIQAAMTDADALQVTYRSDRGEPRGAHKKGEPWEGRGDCIDCHQCVAACPMGIDIRDGDQLECINCALCIDACDDIMKKVGRPSGLIAYDTAKNIALRQASKKPVYRFIRARTILYTILIAVVGGIMLFALSHKTTLDLRVERDRNPIFVRLSDGRIRNGYTIKLENQSSAARTFDIEIEGHHFPLTRKIIGIGVVGEHLTLRLAPAEERELRLYLTGPAAHHGAAVTHPITIEAKDLKTGRTATQSTIFLSGEEQD
jgi:cytochrome c oxidase accessory protein FixG